MSVCAETWDGTIIEVDEEHKGKWVETKDGRIIQVEEMTDDSVIGILIDKSGFKLRYGERVIISRDKLVDDGTEDDLAVIFKNMDEDVNNFFDNVNKIFDEERDFYGRGD